MAPLTVLDARDPARSSQRAWNGRLGYAPGGKWIQGHSDPAAAFRQISFDGKTLRGSRDVELPGHHLVAANAPAVHAVLAQIRVDAKTTEHKAALELLGILSVKGKVVVGDAMFCRRDLAEAVVDSGGDSVFTVKDNQSD